MGPNEITALTDVSIRRKIPKVIAHRGARREAPENTIPAFQRAIDLGTDGIEFDVLLTQDKVPVITHNDDLSILTNFKGYVHTMPFDAVRSLDVGSHFSAGSAGITMPTLAEAMELIARYDILTIIEIKAQPGLIASAAQLIGGMASDIRMRGPVVISSSNWRIIHELSRRHPRLRSALIVKRPPLPFFPVGLFAKYERIAAIHPSMRALWPSVIQKVKELGCEIFPWTANEISELELCMSYEVDGVITDDVAFARKFIHGRY